MQLYLTPSSAKRVDKLARNSVTLFRNDLKRRFDSERSIQFGEPDGEVTSSFRLNVMRHDRAGGMTIRPEPDEWDFLNAMRSKREDHEFFKNVFHRAIDRPAWKRNSLPAFQIDPL